MRHLRPLGRQPQFHCRRLSGIAFTAPPRGIKFWALQYLPYVELLQPLWLRDEIIESIGKNKYLK